MILRLARSIQVHILCSIIVLVFVVFYNKRIRHTMSQSIIFLRNNGLKNNCKIYVILNNSSNLWNYCVFISLVNGDGFVFSFSK